MRREEQAGPCSSTMDFLAHNHEKIYAEQHSMHLLLCQVGDAGNLPPTMIAEQLHYEHQFRLTVGVEQIIWVVEKAEAVTDSRDREKNLIFANYAATLSFDQRIRNGEFGPFELGNSVLTEIVGEKEFDFIMYVLLFVFLKN